MSKRRLVVAALAVALVAVVLLAARPDGESTPVTARSLVLTAEIRGSLLAEDSIKFGPPAQIQSQWNFKIAYLAPEGSNVEPGDQLISFDTTDLQTQLLEAMSKLETAEANLEKRATSTDLEQEDRDLALAEAQAEAERARLKVEAPEDLVASKELEQAHIDLEAAEKKYSHLTQKTASQADQARSQLANLQNRAAASRDLVRRLESEIASMTVVAPVVGTVVYETNWRGEKKKVGDQTNRMQKILALPDLNRLRATAQIDEVFAAELAIGQPVTFALDALPEELFEGRIRGINPAVQQRSRRDPRKALTVDIELTNPDPERMRPGMRIEGNLEILRTDPIPAIPIDSLTWTDGRPAVTVQGWFGQRTAYPELGRRDDEWIEILSGLSLDDRIVLSTSSVGGTL